VKKDAGMLEAFGKGASEDIHQAKTELYSQLCYDPSTNQSANVEVSMTTPLPSPPPSPKPRENEGGGAQPSAESTLEARQASAQPFEA
jgi:inositol-hexakisphosphate/diphosphoinositol-pentakisphosphate 1-kinase